MVSFAPMTFDGELCIVRLLLKVSGKLGPRDLEPGRQEDIHLGHDLRLRLPVGQVEGREAEGEAPDVAGAWRAQLDLVEAVVGEGGLPVEVTVDAGRRRDFKREQGG